MRASRGPMMIAASDDGAADKLACGNAVTRKRTVLDRAAARECLDQARDEVSRRPCPGVSVLNFVTRTGVT
jgi:hypothetical protein